MGKQSYRPEEDQFVAYRCCCTHLNRDHEADGKGACDWATWCGCGKFIPVIDPETGNVREAS